MVYISLGYANAKCNKHNNVTQDLCLNTSKFNLNQSFAGLLYNATSHLQFLFSKLFSELHSNSTMILAKSEQVFFENAMIIPCLSSKENQSLNIMLCWSINCHSSTPDWLLSFECQYYTSMYYCCTFLPNTINNGVTHEQKHCITHLNHWRIFFMNTFLRHSSFHS